MNLHSKISNIEQHHRGGLRIQNLRRMERRPSREQLGFLLLSPRRVQLVFRVRFGFRWGFSHNTQPRKIQLPWYPAQVVTMKFHRAQQQQFCQQGTDPRSTIQDSPQEPKRVFDLGVATHTVQSFKVASLRCCVVQFGAKQNKPRKHRSNQASQCLWLRCEILVRFR